jgi:hypothetical protein
VHSWKRISGDINPAAAACWLGASINGKGRIFSRFRACALVIEVSIFLVRRFDFDWCLLPYDHIRYSRRLSPLQTLTDVRLRYDNIWPMIYFILVVWGCLWEKAKSDILGGTTKEMPEKVHRLRTYPSSGHAGCQMSRSYNVLVSDIR